MLVWDYKMPQDWEPASDVAWRWFLVRKINYGDFGGLSVKMLNKYFPAIKKQLDPGKRAMFQYFLSYGIK